MKLNGRKSVFRLLVATMLVSLSACMDDHDENVSRADSDVLVKFAIQLPGTTTPTTRALNSTDENYVAEIDVLVFEQGGGLTYTAECSGSSINTDEGNDTKKTFTVELRQGNYDLAIVANAHSIVAATTLTGKTKAEAMAALAAEMPSGGKWLTDKTDTGYRPMPMWGDIGNKTINEQTDLTGDNAILLTRMLARVDVKVDASISNFELTSVRVYNYNTHGAITPAGTAWNLVEGKWKATVPTVPSIATLTQGPLVYDNEDGKTEIDGDENNCVKEIYIFEAENHTGTEHTTAKTLQNRTCLVVGGKYGTSANPTYYRIDFSSTGTGASQTFLDVLRNHQYIFNITKVSGAGYETPDIAFKSEPINIEANVLLWNQAEINVFDGQHILSVSRAGFTFDNNAITTATDDNVLYVMTDYTTAAAGGTSGWYIEKIVDADDDTQDVTWVKTTSNGATVLTSGAANSRVKVVLAIEKNSLGEDRSAEVWIAAGRLRYAVTVTQSATESLYLQLSVGGQSTNSDISFVCHQGVVPSGKTLTVKWKPKDSDLNITNTAVSFNGFGTGAPGTGVLDGSTGSTNYYIRPSFTAAQLDETLGGTQFREGVSKLNFAVTKDGQTATANIFVSYINYGLVADGLEDYILDGQTRTVKIRANYEWEITSVTDVNGILQDENALVGRTGGNKTAIGTGDEIQFTLAPFDLSKMGKGATITFTNLIDGTTYDLAVRSALYVGYFGGTLKADANGVWKFERTLFVQTANEPSSDWATIHDFTGASSDRYGKSNTLAINQRSSTNYMAANRCFQKNNNWSSITTTSNTDYNWYLPAWDQLMAIYVTNTSFDTSYRLSSLYWSSSENSTAENNGTLAFAFNMSNTDSGTLNKIGTSIRVRCVREIN